MKNIFKRLLSFVVVAAFAICLASCAITEKTELKFSAFPEVEYELGADEAAFLEAVVVSVDGVDYSLEELKENGAIVTGVKLNELGSHTLMVNFDGATIMFQYDVVLGNEVELDGVAVKTLAEALETANKDTAAHTIKLLKNVNSKVSFTVAKGADVALDLNGHKLYHVSEYKGGSNFIINKGSLTVVGEGGSIVFMSKYPDLNWGGSSENKFPGYACNTIKNEGTLIVNGNVTIENQTPRGGASYVVDNYCGATLKVMNGTLLQSGGDLAIRTFADRVGEANAINIEIHGGNVIGRRAIWVQLAGSNPAQAPIVNVTIKGGKLEATQRTVYVYSYGQSHENVTLNVEGGEFTWGEGYHAIEVAEGIGEPTINNSTSYEVYDYRK